MFGLKFWTEVVAIEIMQCLTDCLSQRYPKNNRRKKKQEKFPRGKLKVFLINRESWGNQNILIRVISSVQPNYAINSKGKFSLIWGEPKNIYHFFSITQVDTQKIFKHEKSWNSARALDSSKIYFWLGGDSTPHFKTVLVRGEKCKIGPWLMRPNLPFMALENAIKTHFM